MATNNANSDIEILVGVQGGESISEGSGQLISSTLKKIAKNISQQQLINITVGADGHASKNSIQKTLNQIDVKLYNIGIGSNVANRLQNQLDGLNLKADTISAKFVSDFGTKLQNQLNGLKLTVDINGNITNVNGNGSGNGNGGGNGGGGRDVDWQAKNTKTANALRSSIKRAQINLPYDISNVDELNKKLKDAEDALLVLEKLDVDPFDKALPTARALVDAYKAAVKEYINLRDAQLASPVNGNLMTARLDKINEIRNSVNLGFSINDPQYVRNFKSQASKELADIEKLVKDIISGNSTATKEDVDKRLNAVIKSIVEQNKKQQEAIELQERYLSNWKLISEAIKYAGVNVNKLNVGNTSNFENTENAGYAESQILEVAKTLKALDGLDDEIAIDGKILKKDNAVQEGQALIDLLVQMAKQSENLTKTEKRNFDDRLKAQKDFVNNYVKGSEKILKENKKFSSDNITDLESIMRIIPTASQITNGTAPGGTAQDLQKIKAEYEALKKELEQYGVKASNIAQQDKDSILARIEALRKLAETYRNVAAPTVDIDEQNRIINNAERLEKAIKDASGSTDVKDNLSKLNVDVYVDDKNVNDAISSIYKLNTELMRLDGYDPDISVKVNNADINKNSIIELYNKLIEKQLEFAETEGKISVEAAELYDRDLKLFKNYVSKYIAECEKKNKANTGTTGVSNSVITAKNSENQALVDQQLKRLDDAIIGAGSIRDNDVVQKKYAELRQEIQKCAESAEKYGYEQEKALKIAIAGLGDVISEQRKLAKESSLDSRNAATVRSEDALANFDKYLKTLNPKALTECSAEIENIKRLLQENTPAAFKQAELAIKSFKAQMKNMGYEGGNILTFLEGKIKTFAVYLISSELTNKFVETLAKVGSTVIELDAALTDLRIVTGSTKDAAKELLATYNEMAQELGATTVATAQSAVEWQRQGYNIQDTNELIKDSMVLSVVGMVDSADAAQYLTSAVKGYKVEVSDAMGIVDKLTAVDLKAAVSAGGLAEAMARTANSARQAGVDMNSLIGYIAAVGEVTQRDMATVGEAFKSIFARYGNVKLGKLIDDESGESLNDFEIALSAVGISLRNQEGQFRDFNDVMVELGKSYQSMSEVERSAIATTLGGVRQRENVLVLLENLDKAFGYAETAANSAGTAMQKFSVYEESVEHSAQKMAAAFERFSSWTIDSSLIAGVYELAAAALNAASTFPSWIKDLVAFNAALLAASAAVKSFNASTLGESFRKTFEDLGWPKKTGDIVPIYSKKAA